MKDKDIKEVTGMPITNKNVKVHGNFADRLKIDNIKRSQVDFLSSEKIAYLKPDLKELTFSPEINRGSSRINRSVK